MPHVVCKDTFMIVKDINDTHEERWRSGAFYIFDTICIKKKLVEQESFMKLSIVKTSNNEILIRIVYPDASGKYSLRHPIDESLLGKNIDLIWATPVIACCYDPENQGATKAY